MIPSVELPLIQPVGSSRPHACAAPAVAAPPVQPVRRCPTTIFVGTTILVAELHVLVAIYIGTARKNLLTAPTRLVAGEADFRSGIDRLATVR